MKVTTFASLLTSALFAQQAAAIDWSNAQTFSCPANTNNNCSDTQKSGFNWNDLPTGNVGSYNGFQFSGFTCSNTFTSAKIKRSLALRADFNSKCVQGKASANPGNNPKITCDGSNHFSITNMQVSVDQDTTLDFHFDMPDGSSCKQTHKCAAAGTVVSNEQCGGAKAVSVQVNKNENRDCEFGIHSINFDCSPPQTTSKSSSTTPVTTTTTSTVSSATTSNIVTTTSAKSSPSTTSVVSTTPASSSPTTTSAAITTSTGITTTTTGATETAPVTTTSIPISSTSTSTTTITSPASSDQVTTEIVITTLTTCPVTVTSVSLNSTITSVGTTISTTTITSTATFCPKCGETPPTAITPSTPVETGPSSNVVSSSTSIGPVTASTSTTTQPIVTTSSVPATTPASSASTTSATTTAPGSSATSVTTSTPGLTTTIPESSSITTEIVITTLTSCSATITTTSGSVTITSIVPTVSTTVITSTVTVCTRCTEAPPSTLQSSTAIAPTTGSSSAPPTQSSSVSPPPNVPCPEIVPRCLNTWLMAVPSCQSNSDITCFCPDKTFISKVQACISAWGGSDAELQGAFSYLTGICANFVPQNPGICTGVPSTITLVPSPTPVPVTSIKTLVSTVGTSIATITITSTKQATITATPASQPITTITITSDHSGVMTTQYITVPQVVFITNTATSVIQTTVNAAGNTVITTMPPPAGNTPPVGLVPALPEITSSLAAAAAAAASPSPALSTSTMVAPASSGGKNSAISTPTKTINPVSSYTGAAAVGADAKVGLRVGIAGVLAVVAFVV